MAELTHTARAVSWHTMLYYFNLYLTVLTYISKYMYNVMVVPSYGRGNNLVWPTRSSLLRKYRPQWSESKYPWIFDKIKAD